MESLAHDCHDRIMCAMSVDWIGNPIFFKSHLAPQTLKSLQIGLHNKLLCLLKSYRKNLWSKCNASSNSGVMTPLGR